MKYLALLILFVSISIPGSAYAATLSRPGNSLGMSLYWNFDEGAGTRVIDRSGNKNDGIFFNAPTWVNGKYGKALQFNGTTQYVSKSAPVNNLPTSAITVSAWVKINSHANWYDLVRNNWGTVDAAAPWNLFSDSAGRINFGIWPQSGPDQGMFYAQGCSSTFTTSTWHHIAGTYDGNTLVAVYLDGVLCATTNSGQAHALYTGGPIAVGEAADGTTHQVDDVRIYRRAFSATEIAALYRQGKSGIKTVARGGLVGEWKFDEGAGTTAHNSTNYTTQATLVNSATWTTGRHGKSVKLDGNNQYVTIPGSSELNISSVTTAFWFTLTTDPECDAGNNYRMLFNKLSGVTGWRVVLEQDKSVQFDVGIAGVQSRSGGRSVGMRVGVPVYLAFTYDAATGDQKIWANGLLVYTKANTPAPMDVNSSPFIIGGGGSAGTCPSSGNGYVPGTYDDFRIYNRALSADEIYALYKERAVALNSSQNGELTNGLVGMWSFNGADVVGTTTVTDGSGNGNSGTVVGAPKRVAGRVGQAFWFTGNQYITTSIAPSTTAYTKSAWVKLTASTCSGSNNIISSGGSATAFWASSGNLCKLAAGHNNSWTQVMDATPLAQNTWYHVAVTYDSTVAGGTMKLYKNSVLVSSATGISAPPSVATVIGGHNGGNYMVGVIDEARLYNRALSDSEIKQLYLMGK